MLFQRDRREPENNSLMFRSNERMEIVLLNYPPSVITSGTIVIISCACKNVGPIINLVVCQPEQ